MTWRRIMAGIGDLGARLRHLRVYDQRLSHQLQEIAVLRKVIESFSVDCIFDIGANQGQYASMLRGKVGFRGTILSVEPNPEIFRILRQAADADARWHADNIALAGHDGEQCLSIMAGHQFTSLSDPIATRISNIGDLNVVTKRIMVPVKTLKTYYLEAKSAFRFARPFLKMDTQGYDAVIARSAGEIIREFTAIQTELSFVRLYSDSIPFQQACDLYGELGFTLCAIVPNNAGHFPYLIEQDAIFINNEFLPCASGAG
ncbi:MAG: FkbM family methyltransferase [Pseudolabrys sp.]|nr:FkbM family methyltransferase [Pseudolabrys sp.]